MGIGVASGERRAADAAQQAIASPLLEEIDISGARGVLVNISGSSSMTMEEFDEASRIIHEKVHEDANIIVGLVIDEELEDRIKITAIATGFGSAFEKSKRVEEELKGRSMKMQQTVNHDLPTFIRERQKNSPRSIRQPVAGEDEYDIPTFIRKRVD